MIHRGFTINKQLADFFILIKCNKNFVSFHMSHKYM